MNSKGYVQLPYVLASLKNDLGMHDFDRDDESLMQWIIDAFAELNMFSGEYGVKSVWLDMDSNGRIAFPEDYISYDAIGVAYNGRMWTYGRDGRIITTREDSCGVSVPNSDRGELVQEQRQSGVHFDQSGGWNFNYFKEDRETRQFFFDNTNQTEVLLVYRTTGITMDSELQLPRITVPYLKEYCQFKLSRRNKEPYNATLANESRLYHEQSKLKKSLRRITADELSDVIYNSAKQTIKR